MSIQYMHINQIFYIKFQHNTNSVVFFILNFNKDKIEKSHCQRIPQFVYKLSYQLQLKKLFKLSLCASSRKQII